LVSAETEGKTIVFAATKRDADRLAEELCAKGHSAGALHGDMKQHQRNRTIDDLRRGRIRLLIATDVAARGIDISDITQVINFDLPKVAEDYVHRIGRTGRAGATGTAYSFFTRSDWSRPSVRVARTPVASTSGRTAAAGRMAVVDRAARVARMASVPLGSAAMAVTVMATVPMPNIAMRSTGIRSIVATAPMASAGASAAVTTRFVGIVPPVAAVGASPRPADAEGADV
jgi:hypothetical protein